MSCSSLHDYPKYDTRSQHQFLNPSGYCQFKGRILKQPLFHERGIDNHDRRKLTRLCLQQEQISVPMITDNVKLYTGCNIDHILRGSRRTHKQILHITTATQQSLILKNDLPTNHQVIYDVSGYGPQSTSPTNKREPIHWNPCEAVFSPPSFLGGWGVGGDVDRSAAVAYYGKCTSSSCR